VKIVADAEELKSLEGLSDADLVKLVRDGFKKFRAGRDDSEAEDGEDPPADPSGAGHGGRSKATLETTASQRAGTIRATEDSAQRAAIERTQAAARQIHEANIAQDARDDEAATIIHNYNRL
jgi:hypothetical protein